MRFLERPQTTYVFGAIVVWAGLVAATAVILGGTSHFGEMLPILFLGAVYFIVIAPGGIWGKSAQSSQSHSTRAKREQ